MKRDLKAVGVGDGNWYSEAQDRRKWKEVWGQSLSKRRCRKECGVMSVGGASGE